MKNTDHSSKYYGVNVELKLNIREFTCTTAVREWRISFDLNCSTRTAVAHDPELSLSHKSKSFLVVQHHSESDIGQHTSVHCSNTQ